MSSKTQPKRPPGGGPSRRVGGARERRRRPTPFVLWGTLAVVLVAVLGGLYAARAGGAGAGTQSYVGEDLHSLVVDPSDPNRVLVGGHQGAAMSADGGATWRPIDGLAGADPMGLVMDPRDRRLLYAAGHPGFRRSLDGGGTWSDRNGTLPSTDVHGLGMDPRHPDVLYAYVVGQGILRSADRGAHWAVVNTSQSLMGPILVDPRVGTTLHLADLQGGFQESVDGGRTWHQVGSIPNGMAMWVSQDQHRPQTFYAASGGIWRSDDGGRTWQALAGAPGGVTTVAVAPSDPRILYAAALQGTGAKVFRSVDGGQHWQARN